MSCFSRLEGLKLLFKLAKHSSSENLKGTPVNKTEFIRVPLVLVGAHILEAFNLPNSPLQQLEDSASQVGFVDWQHQNCLVIKHAFFKCRVWDPTPDLLDQILGAGGEYLGICILKPSSGD